MNPKFRAAGRALTALTAGALFVLTVSIAGQAPAPAGQAAKPAAPSAKPAATPSGKPYVPPKTAWGEPDIQGMFNFSYVGSVPLERCGGGGTGRAPAELVEKGRAALEAARAREEAAAKAQGETPAAGRGGRGGRAGGGFGGRGGAPCDPAKAELTEEEYQARLAAAAKAVDRHANLLETGDFGGALQAGVTDPTTPQRQTSLIVDPPDGRLPALTPEGQRRMMLARSSWEWFGGEGQVWDAPEDFDHWDRCITRGLPASMGPYRYNNGMRILQAPGYVVLDLEMIHESRIIPTDGRAINSPVIKQYMGQSRGRWENDRTLVIETTNIKVGASMTNIGIAGSPPGNRIPTSDQLKITERITATAPGMIEYSITTDDPVILTRPWTARFPLKDDPTYEWWEYACHEGNTAIPNYINASRAARAAQQEAPAAGQQPARPQGGRTGGAGQ